MTPLLRETSRTASALLVFCIVGAAGLAGAYTLTRPNIEASERLEKMALISQVLPANGFDNDLIGEARPLAANPHLGLRRPSSYYLATRSGQPVGVVLEAIAPDGYAGEIKLLIGILADGRISGVRVTVHRETPGLGDYIEIRKNKWIRQFDGKAVNQPAAADWHVRKDGGQFEYMVGATITPRAIVKAVHKALVWYEANKALLLAGHQAKGAGS
jgi:electron transport complex protein RnfG